MVILLIQSPFVLISQEVHDYQYYDSVTYSLYTSGKWDDLIDLGKTVIKEGIDYKYLRQRIGYAYFTKGDFQRARSNFDKALSFDSYDQLSLEYLYYSYLNIGKEDYSGIIVKGIDPAVKKILKIKAINPVESIEAEYNFKYAGTPYRSNPQYYRFGATTKLGYRLSLMQSFSKYNQFIEIQQTGANEIFPVRQSEYYALLKMLISSHISIKTGYHYLNLSSGTLSLIGNLFSFSVAPELKGFTFEFNGSALMIDTLKTYQVGMQAGYQFPGQSGFYFSSSVP